MAQSPSKVTSISSTGPGSNAAVAVGSVYLGGKYRNVQASLTVPSGSSSPAGTLWASAGPAPGIGSTLLQVTSPSIGSMHFSDVATGFFDYVFLYTQDISSAYWNDIVFTVYFDGTEWVSS